MRPALRIAALMQVHVIFIFTHESIGLGEDGVTHQPVEHLMGLRGIPGERPSHRGLAGRRGGRGTRGWRDLVGDEGAVIGIDRFGAAGPGKVVYEGLGVNVDRVAEVTPSVATS